jgi:hypothetical protein
MLEFANNTASSRMKTPVLTARVSAVVLFSTKQRDVTTAPSMVKN